MVSQSNHCILPNRSVCSKMQRVHSGVKCLGSKCHVLICTKILGSYLISLGGSVFFSSLKHVKYLCLEVVEWIK